MRQVDERLRARAADEVGQAAQSRKEAQDKTRVIDARNRELSAYSAQAQKIRQQLAEATRMIDAVPRDALSPPAVNASATTGSARI